MKTKKILTLLIAMMIGVFVSAQDFRTASSSRIHYPPDKVITGVDDNASWNLYFSLYSQFVRIWAVPQKPVYLQANPDTQPVIRLMDVNKKPAHFAKKRPKFKRGFDTKTYSNGSHPNY